MKCSYCGTNLVIGENYTEARLRKKYYICKTCNNKKKQMWRKNNRSKDRKTRRCNNHSRRSKLGYNELYPNPYPDYVEVDWHHINDVDVVAIPRWLHKKYTNPDRVAHRRALEMYVAIIYPT